MARRTKPRRRRNPLVDRPGGRKGPPVSINRPNVKPAPRQPGEKPKPPVLPALGTIRLLAADDRGQLDLRAMCGDIVIQPGGGGVEVVQRPGRVGLTVWRGSEPARMTVPLVLDTWAYDSPWAETIWKMIGILRDMAGEGKATPPPKLWAVSSGIPPEYRGKLWWMETPPDFSGGEVPPILRVSDGVPVRRAVTVQLIEVVEDDRLDRVRRRKAAPKYRTVTARQGDTWAKIAARELGGRKFGGKLARLNGGKRATEKVKKGRKVRVPTGEVLARWKRELRKGGSKPNQRNRRSVDG